jgi:hypothetical protein
MAGFPFFKPAQRRRKSMANDRQMTAYQEGGDPAARSRFAQAIPLAMSAGAAVAGSINIPPGSWITGVRAETASAFSGAPTHINLTVGSTSGGSDIVAATDIQAQGEVVPSMPAAFDRINNNDSQVFAALTAVGGTNPAGICNVIVEYYPPVA